MAKINYQQIGWDTTKYFNPTNMNHMDDGIKAACDKADANEESISDVNNKLGNTDISAIGDGTLTGGLDALNSNLGQYGTGIINLFSQNPYTAPSDGFVIAFANPKTTNTEGIIVSGTLTPLQCKCVNGNACTSTTLVKKGSRIQIDATSGLEPTSVCVYVPLHN